MKTVQIRGEDAAPCITPVRKVMIAYLGSYGSMHAVVLPYMASNRSTSGMLYALITSQSVLWDMELNAF